MSTEQLSSITATLLGLTFLVSGLGKLRDRSGFVMGVLEYEMLPVGAAIVFARIIPFAEVVLGVALMLALWPPMVGLISIALLCSFLLAVVVNILRGKHMQCHCFGAERGESIGWTTVVRLLFLVLCASSIAVWHPQMLLSHSSPNPVPTLLTAVGLMLLLYFQSVVPTFWSVWQLKATPMSRMSSGRVNLRKSSPQPQVLLPMENTVGSM